MATLREFLDDRGWYTILDHYKVAAYFDVHPDTIGEGAKEL